MKWRREEGLTLVELLAALAISGMIIAMVNTLLVWSLGTYNKVMLETKLRNESNYILAQLNQTLLNSDVITTTDPNNSIKIFTATTASASPISHDIVLYDEGSQAVSLKIDGKTINNSNYSLYGSYFFKDDYGLRANLEIRRKNSTIKPMFISTTFGL
jgi:prepilin-type N-terminal cleavage/methylation domain-containing protein